MNEKCDFLIRRRSVSAGKLTEPGPDDAALKTILNAALRVPDHGKLGPWRLLVCNKQAQQKLSAELMRIFTLNNPEKQKESKLEKEQNRLLRAPLLVIVISSPVVPHKIPEWEQILSCGAVCQNLLNACHALGYSANWLTEWPAYDPGFYKVLEMEKHEKIAGFFYIGTKTEEPEERKRPSVEDRVRFL